MAILLITLSVGVVLAIGLGWLWDTRAAHRRPTLLRNGQSRRRAEARSRYFNNVGDSSNA